jgi:diguanylate cyclase (GGDEF)-like protein
LFVLLLFLRRWNRPPDDPSNAASYVAWRRRHWALIHGGCLLWSVVFVDIGTIEQGYPSALTIAVICAVTFGAALSQAFAMERAQATLALAFLYGPALVAFTRNPTLRPVAVTLVAYAAYLLSSLRRLSGEYEAQIQTEYALLLSRSEVERLTRIDSLTGLPNRREYEYAFPRVWHYGARQKVELSVLVLDIDHFKTLNDRHGHLAGDACLQHFATLMKRHFRREADVLARIGGEEFVVLLPGSSVADAARVAERFRASLEGLPCEWEGEKLRFTVSIGVGGADWSRDVRPEATFARVDRACYQAKARGRNRIVCAEAPAVGPPLPMPQGPSAGKRP